MLYSKLGKGKFLLHTRYLLLHILYWKSQYLGPMLQSGANIGTGTFEHMSFFRGIAWNVTQELI